MKFSDKQISKANQVDILELAKNFGYETKREGRNYRLLNQGGSLIDPNKNSFYSFTTEKGGGPIQFIMQYQNKSWVESVKYLLGNSQQYNTYTPPNNYKKENVKFELPEKNKTYKHVFAYLIKTRGIDQDLISRLVKNKKIYENNKKSCVFVGHDEAGEAKYATVRSTNTNGKVFKGEVKGSCKDFAFSIKGDSQICNVFEAPIDLMSYITINKIDLNTNKDSYITLGCLADKALARTLNQNINIKEINLCFDRDYYGLRAAADTYKKYKDYKVKIQIPKENDWNESLIKRKSRKLADISKSVIVSNKNLKINSILVNEYYRQVEKKSKNVSVDEIKNNFRALKKDLLEIKDDIEFEEDVIEKHLEKNNENELDDFEMCH